GVVLVRGGGDEEKQASVPSEATASQTNPSRAASEAASGNNEATAEPLKAEAPNPPSEPSEAVAKASEVIGEASFYKIEEPVVMDSCEKTLGKTAADFASA